MKMLQIGELTHINPADVVAVGWYTYSNNMPVVYVAGGHHFPADLYLVTPETDHARQTLQPSIPTDLKKAAIEALNRDIEKAAAGQPDA